jgi:hypothetical protein
LKHRVEPDSSSERPAKRQKTTIDLVADDAEEPRSEVVVAKQQLDAAVKHREHQKDVVDAFPDILGKITTEHFAELDAVNAKYMATKQQLYSQHEKDLESFDKARQDWAEAWTRHKNTENRAVGIDRFWGLVNTFLHQGQYHVACDDHGVKYARYFTCFHHHETLPCVYNCIGVAREAQCPGCFAPAGLGQVRIIRNQIKGECDEFSAEHDGGISVYGYRCSIGPSYDSNKPQLCVVGACKDCEAKTQSIVAFKNGRVATLVALLDSVVPKVISDVASQYLVFSRSRCFVCHPLPL